MLKCHCNELCYYFKKTEFQNDDVVYLGSSFGSATATGTVRSVVSNTSNVRLYLHNTTGTLIGMVHIMLPFLILPLYANMRAIDKDCLKAASSLGATPTRAFWTVFFPLSLPGLFAGLLIVFVLCLGFYVTPAILGGGRVIMAAMKISSNIELYFSWGAASALGVVLLVVTMAILFLASKLVSIDQISARS